jgi:hypothetical protein
MDWLAAAARAFPLVREVLVYASTIKLADHQP